MLDLRTDVFVHGQLYTTLLRVRNRRDVQALWSTPNEEKETANKFTIHYCCNK
ncbi:hypothetical protein BDR04DRAFT_1111933 [Suillus decipiens]|nr:hypothetical protein BDR04DRAFT_1111933 [Suillus decipiens]